MRCIITKPFRTKLNLLEEGAVLKCRGGFIGLSSAWIGEEERFTSPDFSFEGRGFYYRILRRTLVIEKGAMP